SLSPPSTIGAGRYRGSERRLGEVLARREEAQLLRPRRARQPPAAQREEPPGPSHVDAGRPKVSLPADPAAAARGHEALRRRRADAGYTHQRLVGRAADLDRKQLGMGERPGRLRVVVKRQVAVGPEDELVVLKAVLPKEMLRLVEPELARGRCGALPLQRRPHDRLESAEVSVMKEASPLEPGHGPKNLQVRLTRRTDDELGRRSDRAGSSRPLVTPAVEDEPPGQLELRQQVSAEVLLSCQSPHVAVTGRLEVDRPAARAAPP